MSRAVLAGPTVDVARRLLGMRLVHDGPHGRCAGRIVETEAYLAEGDEASHSFRGPTPRNASMFLSAGHVYVYLIYGMHLCFNVVTGPAGVGEAVLVRALEPLEGLEQMRARRGDVPDRELCNGPGKLAQALGIERTIDGASLGIERTVDGKPLGIESAVDGAPRLLAPTRGWSAAAVRVGPRVGITRSADLPLRFWCDASPYVSRARPAGPRRPPISRAERGR